MKNIKQLFLILNEKYKSQLDILLILIYRKYKNFVDKKITKPKK